MAIRFIQCWNTITGAETELPETALQHLPAWQPVDEDNRVRLGYDKPPADTPADAGDPAEGQPARKRKPATGAAKNTKE